MLDQPTGSVVKSDLQQLAPEELVPDAGLVGDGGLATIGGGNHFVEVQ